MPARNKSTRGRRPANVASANGGWVRMMSPKHTGYRTLVSPRQMQAFGPPRDPWGAKMVPAKGVAPRLVNRDA